MNEHAQSEIARLRWQIQTEYEAAERGLSGLASGVSRHAFITAKTENISQYHEALVALVGPDAAILLLAETIWPSTTQKAANV